MKRHENRRISVQNRLICGGLLLFVMSFLFAPARTLASPDFDLECFVSVKSKGIIHFKRCAMRQNDGTLKILKSVLNKMSFDDYELSGARITGCYWVNRKGIAKKTSCFDNGADYFSEGLTRHIAPDGKFGFMKRKLQVVILPIFDFVFPFENGTARFCQGCNSVQDGEHYYMSGGKWGYVDKQGSIDYE